MEIEHNSPSGWTSASVSLHETAALSFNLRDCFQYSCPFTWTPCQNGPNSRKRGQGLTPLKTGLRNEAFNGSDMETVRDEPALVNKVPIKVHLGSHVKGEPVLCRVCSRTWHRAAPLPVYPKEQACCYFPKVMVPGALFRFLWRSSGSRDPSHVIQHQTQPLCFCPAGLSILKEAPSAVWLEWQWHIMCPDEVSLSIQVLSSLTRLLSSAFRLGLTTSEPNRGPGRRKQCAGVHHVGSRTTSAWWMWRSPRVPSLPRRHMEMSCLVSPLA